MLKACQEWDDRYLVGDLLVDGEHKRLIEMSCAFGRLIEVNALSYREALKIVREVLFHVTTHFQHEELLLQIYNADPEEIEMHKKEHTKLKIILCAAAEEVRDHQDCTFKDACINLTNIIYELVTNHIATVDKETLEPCIRKHDRHYACV